MKITPFLADSSPNVFLLLAVAVIALVLLVRFSAWVIRMRDACIQRERIKRMFVTHTASTRLAIIEQYRTDPTNSAAESSTQIMREIAHYATTTRTNPHDILAMLVSWNCDELVDTQHIADP
jgi:hypothetical protein